MASASGPAFLVPAGIDIFSQSIEVSIPPHGTLFAGASALLQAHTVFGLKGDCYNVGGINAFAPSPILSRGIEFGPNKRKDAGPYCTSPAPVYCIHFCFPPDCVELRSPAPPERAILLSRWSPFWRERTSCVRRHSHFSTIVRSHVLRLGR
jgi:hypothetical protein